MMMMVFEQGSILEKILWLHSMSLRGYADDL